MKGSRGLRRPLSQQTPAKFKVSNASLVVMRAPIRGRLLLEILPTNRDRVALGRACSTCTMAEIQDILDLSKNDRRGRAREGEKEMALDRVEVPFAFGSAAGHWGEKGDC